MSPEFDSEVKVNGRQTDRQTDRHAARS